jgi:hypothetical protein
MDEVKRLCHLGNFMVISYLEIRQITYIARSAQVPLNLRQHLKKERKTSREKR